MDEGQLLFCRTRSQMAAQLGNSLLIDRCAIRGDYAAQGTLSLLPKSPGQLPAAAAEIEPFFPRLCVQPGDGIGEQPPVRGDLLLAPEGAGASGIGPVIDRSGSGCRHDIPSLDCSVWQMADLALKCNVLPSYGEEQFGRSTPPLSRSSSLSILAPMAARPSCKIGTSGSSTTSAVGPMRSRIRARV